VTDSVLTFLQDHRSAMLEDLRQLVELESPSGDEERLAHCAGFLAQYAQSAGASIQVIEAPGGNRHLRAEWGEGSGRPMLLLGHFDTVWPVGTIGRMPFRLEAGLARGPGVFDMKAGIVQALWAVRALFEARPMGHEIVLLCTSDEETGSATSRELIEQEARRARAVFVLEPSHHGALKTGRKGVAQFRVMVHGKSSHAGLDPEAGVSAIDELAHQILDLRQLANADAGSTINVGVIEGGSRSNVVADRAAAEIDVRFSTGSEAERLTEAILHLRPHDERTRFEVTGGVNRPPLERTAETRLLFERARTISNDLGFRLEEAAVGGGSDGNFCAAVGARVLDGLGAVGGGAHGPDEHVIIDSIPLRAALLCKLLASE
jgi:glutamate carboxypeptidase